MIDIGHELAVVAFMAVVEPWHLHRDKWFDLKAFGGGDYDIHESVTKFLQLLPLVTLLRVELVCLLGKTALGVID